MTMLSVSACSTGTCLDALVPETVEARAPGTGVGPRQLLEPEDDHLAQVLVVVAPALTYGASAW